jgi:nitrite reductase/ring-hydroxylating ferredoxin subunit
MGFEFAALTSDLANEKMKGVEVGGQQLLLANLDGRFYAVARKYIDIPQAAEGSGCVPRQD